MQPQRLPDSLPVGVEVFQLALNLAAPLPEADWALLSEEERLRAQRFYKHDDKVRFVATRAALRLLLGARLHCCPQTLRFVTNPYGKPRLEMGCSSPPGIYFNVSHSGGFALISLSERLPVGIDIERRDPQCDVVGLSWQTLSAFEQQLPDDQRVDFFECWATKEAVLKALGLGIAEHLQQLSVLRPGITEDPFYEIRFEDLDLRRVNAFRLDSPPGYAATLAWPADGMGELH